jgi:hypothetical protein
MSTSLTPSAAVAAHVQGVDPSVEPDAAGAASRTDRLLEAAPLGWGDAALPELVPAFLEEAVGPEDYVSVPRESLVARGRRVLRVAADGPEELGEELG